MNTKEWRALIRFLKKRFPLRVPVGVVRRPYKKLSGWTVLAVDRFVIRVSTEQDVQAQIDTLLHEWAHAKAIDEAYAHKGRWGEIHGEIYDAWAEDYDETHPD
jgi:hypothetical protein